MNVSLTRQQLFRVSVAMLGTTSLISIVSYLLATRPLTEQAIARQRQLLQINKVRIDQWWAQEVKRIGANLQNPELVSRSLLILQAKRQVRSERRSPLSQELLLLLQPDAANRNSVSLLTKGGIVVFSTDQKRLGMYQPLKNTTTSLELVELASTPLNFFTDSITGQPSISVALPIQTPEQKRAGFMAIDLNLQRLHGQVLRHSNAIKGTSQPQAAIEAYLAARTSLDRITLIAPPLKLTANQAAKFTYEPLNSTGLQQALDGQSGEGLYLNSRSEPVIGVYHYLTNFRSALLVESLQRQVYAPARHQAFLIFVIGILLSLIPALAGWRLPAPAQPTTTRP